jgi:nitrogen fixation NifU-like protein
VSGGEQSGAAAHLAGLYREAIRRHAAHPVGYRRPIAATHRHEEYNPLCGDRIEVSLRIAGNAVAEAAFDGEACAICMASASLLCSLAPGRTLAELRQWSEDLHRALDGAVGAGLARDRAQSALLQEIDRGQGSLQQQEQPSELTEELQPLLGVRPYPSRIRCATLPWTAAVSALGA